MWNAVMQDALSRYPQEYFGEPRGIPENAPPALRGQHYDATGAHNILHYVNKDNPLGGGTSQGDGQYPYWEYSVRNWGGVQTGTSPNGLIQEIIPPGLLEELQQQLEELEEQGRNNDG